MVDRTHWRVHRDVAAAVDRLLLNQEAGDELRTFDAAGKVVVVPEAEDDLPSSSQPAAERSEPSKYRRLTFCARALSPEALSQCPKPVVDRHGGCC